MKIRNGFVSNSSSSSFVIKIKKLSKLQIWAIENHIEAARNILDWNLSWDDPESNGERVAIRQDAWDVSFNYHDKTITVDTAMDNFDMKQFLKEIKVKEKYITDLGS